MTPQELPSVINMILLPEKTKLTEEVLKEAASEHGIERFSVTSDSSNADAFVVFWNDVPFILMYVDQPVPQNTFDEVLNYSFGLDNAEKIVKDHKSHIIISPLNKSQHMGNSISYSIGVMEMTVLISRIIKPIGHYWSMSDTLLSQKQFEERHQRMRQALEIQQNKGSNAGSLLPYMFWVGFRLIGSAEAGKMGATTKGFASFTGYELEIVPMTLEPEKLGKQLYSLVEYIFNNGPVFKSGQSVTTTDGLSFLLTMKEKTGDQSARLMLIMEK